MIYLDNASTTKPKKEVVDVVNKYLTDMWTNPSSLYSPSSRIKKDIDGARKTVADFINANKDEIYFTSGGSESNCWALQGFVNSCKSKGQECSVITTTIEHHSIIECVEHLDCDIHFIGVDDKGNVDIEQLKNVLDSISNNNILVSIQYANNEIGTIQKLKVYIDMAHKYGALFHTDATQLFGKKYIDVYNSNIDMLTASGHKIHAPKGIGFLYINNDIKEFISPIIYGTQMDGMRGGTENVPYIMGFAKAVELSCEIDIDNYFKNIDKQYYFIDMLDKNFNVKFNGVLHDYHRLNNNINVTFEDNISSEALIYALDMCEICVSSGSACNSHEDKPSHVLKAIGLSDEDAMRTIRITFSDDITYEEIDIFINELKKCIKLITSTKG